MECLFGLFIECFITGAQVICITNNSCEAKNNNGGCCSCTNCAIMSLTYILMSYNYVIL